MDRIGKPSTFAACSSEEPARSGSPVALYSIDGSEEHVPARILQRQTSFFALRAASCVESGRRLVMVDGNFRYEIQILACTSDGDGFLLDCRVLGCREGTIRQEWRMPVTIPARVTVPSTGLIYSARIRDISPFGMGISLPVQLAVGTVVIVDAKDGFGYGEVRHCRPYEPGGFFAGIYLREYLQKSTWLSRYDLPGQAARWLRLITGRLRKAG